MSGRILNFSEFFDKYSKDAGNKEVGVDDFANSASNFEEGFDKETYNQTQIGPNRPIAGGDMTTPPQPGEEGAGEFSSDQDSEMNAPSEFEAPTETPEETNVAAEAPAEAPEENEEPIEPSEENEAPEEAEEESEEEEEESDEKEEEKKEEETPEPEAGSNPVKESKFSGLLGFNQFVNESHWELVSDDEESDEFGEEDYRSEDEDDDRFSEDHYEEKECKFCGHPIEYTEEGATCGCNM